jgi:hypothetical protein
MAKGKIEDALYGWQVTMFYHAQEQQQTKRFPMRSVDHTFCIFAICIVVFSYFLNVSFVVLPSSLARETSHNCIHCNL